MARAVLDPGVLISALITPTGIPAKLLAATRGGSFELIVPALLLEGLGSVLRRQKFRRHVDLDVVDRYIALLRRDAVTAADLAGPVADPLHGPRRRLPRRPGARQRGRTTRAPYAPSTTPSGCRPGASRPSGSRPHDMAGTDGADRRRAHWAADENRGTFAPDRKGASPVSDRDLAFEDAVIVVTAGGGATGSKVGEAFAAEGARVALLNRSAAPAELAAERIRAAGVGEVKVVEADLIVPDEVESAVKEVVDEWDRIDVLVNNAGGGLSDTIEMPVDTWRQSLQLNLDTMFLTTRAVWPTMVAQKSGVVLNCSSICGITATAGALSYSVAKAGVVMLTKCLALEGAEHGIRVNCVCPGHVDSPALGRFIESLPDPTGVREALLATVPLGYMESEEAVADMYKYLASGQARWVTGSTFVIDGGTTATSL